MTEARAWDGETVSAICGQLASRMRSRVLAIEERDGENAVTGPGVGIGYLFAREIAHALEQASQFSEPPAAPCADEVEVVVVARAFGDALSTRVNMRTYMGDVPNSIIQDAMAEALAALSPLRQAERERAWRDGAEAMREACKRGVLGGRFLHDQAPPAQFARECAEMLDRLPLPPMGGV